ncbi:META domain-containing protein [Corynebacterium sp. H78]|uniref:META domain-containing protein n=1 Tax=Corynebacterium sp. H78 TaxID=3133417 RepID=UPI00309A341B
MGTKQGGTIRAWSRTLTLLGGMLFLSATAGCSAGEAMETDMITDTDWHLSSQRSAYFRIEGEELTGSDSCNRLMGRVKLYDASPSTIDFGAGPASTRMACPDTQKTEEAMREALHGTRAASQTDESTLVLRDEQTGREWTFVQ